MFRTVSFKQQVNHYIRIMGYINVDLTESEYDHLQRYQGNRTATPEATSAQIKDSLDIEVKRGLARRNGFELLNLAGELKATIPALSDQDEIIEILAKLAELHHDFIEEQSDEPLSYDNFIMLAKNAYELDAHLKHAIRISCFLTMNDYLKRTVGPLMGEIKDSEIFLSRLAELINQGAVQLPLTQNVSPETKQHLLTLFYPGMHFRHMLFTEGGVAMFKTFRAGVVAETFTQDMLNAWFWRWTTNLFGFQTGKGAKVYNESMHSIAINLKLDLDELFKNQDADILQSYLSSRAMRAGLDLVNGKMVDENLKKFYGHLAAMFHVIMIDDAAGLGAAMVAGYEAFKQKHQDASQLQDLYIARITNIESTTPTYVPAILNNAYAYFFNETNSVTDAIQLAVEFSCDAFLALEQALALNPKQLISCLEISQRNNLDNLLAAWKDNKSALVFGVGEENDELKLKAIEHSPRLGYRN